MEREAPRKSCSVPMKKERNNGARDSAWTVPGGTVEPPSTNMQSTRIAVSAVPRTRAPQIYKTFMKRFISDFVFCLAGTAAAMGYGSGGGGGDSVAASNPLQQEVGASAFKAYNQGFDLMHVRNFAAAQAMFERAIRDNPNFAEAHNNLEIGRAHV